MKYKTCYQAFREFIRSVQDSQQGETLKTKLSCDLNKLNQIFTQSKVNVEIEFIETKKKF